MARRELSFFVNLLIVVTVAGNWARMFFQRSAEGRLNAANWQSLRFFTVLSNLLEGAAALVIAVCLLRVLTGSAEGIPHWAEILRYAAVTSVGLTFATVMLFLGPAFGYEHMFKAHNLWFHLLVPLIAMLDFLLLDREPISFPETLWAVLPMFLYGVFYMLNAVFLHPGDQNHDWYWLVQGSGVRATISSALMVAGTWALALLLRLPHRGR